MHYGLHSSYFCRYEEPAWTSRELQSCLCEAHHATFQLAVWHLQAIHGEQATDDALLEASTKDNGIIVGIHGDGESAGCGLRNLLAVTCQVLVRCFGLTL